MLSIFINNRKIKDWQIFGIFIEKWLRLYKLNILDKLKIMKKYKDTIWII